jgi:hypothetical protein
MTFILAVGGLRKGHFAAMWNIIELIALEFREYRGQRGSWDEDTTGNERAAQEGYSKCCCCTIFVR